MTTKMTKSRLNNSQLEALKETAAESLSDIVDHFGLNLNKNEKRYYGACPIHGGDKYNAFNISRNGHVGNWKCYTNKCNEIFYGDIIGLVRALLSKHKYKWKDKRDTDKMASFVEAINFIIDFTGCGDNIKTIELDVGKMERKHFVNNIAAIYQPKEVPVGMCVDREDVISSLEIPSKYHLSRGYSAEVLKKYDVGTCNNFKKPFYKRSVAPIYNEEYTKCIGCTGRSIFDECPLCNTWHNPSHKCPETKVERKKFMKWKHNYGFQGVHYLYNYWFSKPFIQESCVAVIVESPGNVWRLEEAGIHNSVCCFGSHLSDTQRNILDKSGALALIVLSDPDEAGKLMNDNIRETCQNTYQLYFPHISPEDIGDTSVEILQKKLIPIINKVKESL